MASAIAAHGHGPEGTGGALGLAPRAKILPVRVSADGHGGDIGAGIRWAVDHGAKVINVSSTSPDLSSIREATTYAVNKGIIIVAGNGNDGTSTIAAPAMYPGVIAVAGLNHVGTLWEKSTRGPETVISAPAVDILSTDLGGKYAVENGTSDATALVAGAAALVWSKYPALDANNVINRLITTADHRGEPGRNASYGFGAVNPLHALTDQVPSVAANPLMVKVPTSTASIPSADAPASASVAPSSVKPSRTATGLLFGVGGVAALLLVVGILAFARRRRTVA